MKKGLFLATICIAVFSLSSCGPSWNPKKVTANPNELKDFTSVDIENYAEATIRIDPSGGYSVKLEGEDDVLKDLHASVEEGTLVIQQKDDLVVTWGDYKKVKIQISVPSLEGLAFGGAGTITTVGNITGKRFDLYTSGAGKVVISEVNVDTLNVESSGVGGIDMKKGTVREANYDFSGAGGMDAFGVLCTNATAEISGVGSIDINVSGKLDASLSGIGNISYKGNPAVNEDISGVGKIDKVN